MERKENYAFLIDTPLQLLNAVNIILSNDKGDCSDAYIVAQFQGADDYVNRINAEKLFRNVYILDKEKKGLFKHFYTLLGLTFPNIYCRFLLKVNIRKKCYREIFLSVPTKMFDFMIAASGVVRINGIEDGIGSYIGDIFHDYLGTTYFKARKALHRDYRVENLYLKSPEYYIGKKDKRIVLLQDTMKNKVCKEIISRIFLYKKSIIYDENIVIYINQPADDFDGHHLETEKNVVKLLEKVTENRFVIRLHPREVHTEIYDGNVIDKENCMWELLCRESISNRNVLIGMFSTTQFVPKFFYNKEPMVVFTYKLYSDLPCANHCRYEKMANFLKSVYKNKNYVCIVETLEELGDLIQAIGND